MCGFTGVWSARSPVACERALAANELLRHRGPDDCGVWHDEAAGIWFGHRRLTVLDHSEAAHQPKISTDGRWVVVYNGEIYNFRELRGRLARAGVQCAGTGDTEALVQSIAAWGVDEAVRRCTGMFAFAAWDRIERELWLVRDRIGEKPMYYAEIDGAVYFASELDAVVEAAGRVALSIDPIAVTHYLRHDYIPAPYSIWKEVRKLRPATIARYRSPYAAEHSAYWSLAHAIEAGRAAPFTGTFDDAAEELQTRLSTAVTARMVADVPVGAFLSGGVDSSAVVALMQASSSRPLHTFSIGFEESDHDESAYASAVAAHLGTQHTEWRVTPAEAMAVIPSLPTVYDEPFGDSSAIPTILVSRLARRDVTVAVTGDGGDEVFGGYGRYGTAIALGSGRVRRVPQLARALGAAGGAAASIGLWRWAFRLQDRALVATTDPARLYWSQLVKWLEPGWILEVPSHALSPDVPVAGLGGAALGMAVDTLNYLPENNLVKLDRAAMSVSLETRVPFLDHSVIDWVWTLPAEYHWSQEETKRLLRRVLYRHVPPHLVERPKMGFSIPVGQWIRGPLRDWAESLFDERVLREGGILHPGRVRRLWRLHRDGELWQSYRVWNLLALQQWLTTRDR